MGIEFGAGISTLFLAKCFERTGGQLVTVENDLKWLQVIENELEKNGIAKSAYKLMHAPLVSSDEFPKGLDWYDAKCFDLNDRKFDFALIDGPIDYESRKMAYPFLKNQLLDSYVLFVDDTDLSVNLNFSKILAKDLSGNWFNYKTESISAIRSNGFVYNIL